MKYIDVLKESIQEADVTKTADVLGPMVEPILGYDGDGDLKTHKNASEILKKYYFENDSDGLVTIDDAETTTKGEKDQSDIDKVKKNVEDIINSDDETDSPTDKTLKEMVSNLEDILDETLTESEVQDDVLKNIENHLLEDENVISALESLLEQELDSGANNTSEEENDNDDDDANVASDDVVIDKDTKVKVESEDKSDSDDNNDADKGEKNDNDGDDDDKSEKNDNDGENLDVDSNLKEMSEIESLLKQESMDSPEFILNNIESILDEQIAPYESIAGVNQDNDIDTNNPMHKDVTTESVEDSVLEWLIMEIEDKESEGELTESDENIDDSFNLDDFDKIEKIDSSKIRV